MHFCINGFLDGGDKVIMPLMPSNDELSTEHIKSHLQKYRIHHQRSKEEFKEFFERYIRKHFSDWSNKQGWESTHQQDNLKYKDNIDKEVPQMKISEDLDTLFPSSSNPKNEFQSIMDDNLEQIFDEKNSAIERMVEYLSKANKLLDEIKNSSSDFIHKSDHLNQNLTNKLEDLSDIDIKKVVFLLQI